MAMPELAMLGRPVLVPPYEQEADWIYVVDAAEAIRLAYRAEIEGHRIYNVSSERRKTGEVMGSLRRLFPAAQMSVAQEPLTMPSLLNTYRMKSELGFVPQYSVEEGMIEYLKDLSAKSNP